MSEFTPLREAVDALAGRTSSPDFRDLQRRATRRGRRRVAMVAATTAAVVTALVLAATVPGRDRRATPPVAPIVPIPGPGVNGWVAADAYQGSGDIYLAGPGGRSRRLDVAGSESASDACPAWSPDGTRLLVARLTGPADSASTLAELVVVPVRQDGTVGRGPVIPLKGFDVRRTTEAEFDAHPCAVWAPDGRWAAFAGAGEVWVVNTRTGETRRLPDRRPSDLEWRPGTDQLTIAGDMGLTRGDPTLSTPVTVYSVSTGRLRRLGAVEAALVTWSPDGTSLAFTGGERDPDSRVLAVADRNGANIRVLVADMGSVIHGIGPVWSPTGERIAYQRCEGGPSAECRGEGHEVVLVDVEDGAETVIAPPTAEGHVWYPFTVTWSPDGTSLLYAAWQTDGEPTPDGGETLPGGVVAVPADSPDRAQVLIDAIDPVPDYYSHRWAPTQMWGRKPG